MPLVGDYEPSPWGPIADQVALYESSGGTEGLDLEGQPCIILTTRGNKSGKLRKTPLMRVEHDGTYAVVASMGGAPKHPVWYFNLLADAHVTLQDGPQVFDLVARQATGDEKALWWGGPTRSGRPMTATKRRRRGRSRCSCSNPQTDATRPTRPKRWCRRPSCRRGEGGDPSQQPDRQRSSCSRVSARFAT